MTCLLFQASDSIVADLRYTGFKVLDLSGSVALTDHGLTPIEGWPLTELSLVGCDRLGDEALRSVATIETLESLRLDNCFLITDSGLDKLIGLTHLKELTLRWCFEISDLGCLALGRMHLEKLVLLGCEKISDVGLSRIVENMELREVALPESQAISDAGL